MRQSEIALLYGMRFRHLLEVYSEELMKKYQLQRIDLMILLYLVEAEGRDTSKDILGLNMFTKGHISQSLSRLQKSGFLDIRRDQLDRRCVHNVVTEKGRDLQKDVHLLQNRIDKIVFQGLTVEEMQEFQRISDKIVNNIVRAL